MPDGPPPKVSMVLAVHDAAPLLLRCLSAIARLPDDGVPFEVVIVDDGSTDETPLMIEHLEGDLVALRNDPAIGYGPSCDRGVAAAGGELIVLLTADAVPVDGWLEPLLAALAPGAPAGAARPRAIDVEGRVLTGPLWPLLALRRSAYERAGGFAAASRPGRADKAALTVALEAAGVTVADEPASIVLVVPEPLPTAG